jgi:hypothetical protein
MWLNLWAFLKPHVWYWVLIAGGLLAFHVWLQEHDARLLLEPQLKASRDKIAELQAQRQQNDQQAAQQKEVIIREVHDAVTPQQKVDLIPNLADNVKLNPVIVPPSPDLPNAPSQVKVDLDPLVSELSQCKQNSIDLGACQSDLRTADAVAMEQNKQIGLLKKKPSFWQNFGRDAAIIGCAGMGAYLGSQTKKQTTGAAVGATAGAFGCSLIF